jgi:hypothetical protein
MSDPASTVTFHLSAQLTFAWKREINWPLGTMVVGGCRDTVETEGTAQVNSNGKVIALTLAKLRASNSDCQDPKYNGERIDGPGDAGAVQWTEEFGRLQYEVQEDGKRLIVDTRSNRIEFMRQR